MPEQETVQLEDGVFAVEKDKNFKGSYPLSVYAEAAKMCGKITEDPNILTLAVRRLEENKLQ